MNINQYNFLLFVTPVALSLYFYQMFGSSVPKLDPHFGGYSNAKFSKVEQLFRTNFENGRELQGAAIAVYHQGELVVDLWGGYADTNALRKWTKHTMTNVFSSTKALTSLSLAHLIDNNDISYDDLVTKHWPEFGKNGKEAITVRMLAEHSAGLALIDDLSYEVASDHKLMSKFMEEQRPNWIPGTMTGYHAFSFGILRVDKQHRTLGQYFQEEILRKTGSLVQSICHSNEFCFIGLPSSEEHRVTRMLNSPPYGIKGYLIDFVFKLMELWHVVRLGESNMSKALRNPSWIFGPGWMQFNGLNNPDVHRLELGAANGICTARGLAQAFNAVVMGDLLSKEIVEELSKTPQRLGDIDWVINYPQEIGLGFWHSNSTKNSLQLGHPGFGGQLIRFDMEHRLAFAYVTNGLQPVVANVDQAIEILDTVYTCL